MEIRALSEVDPILVKPYLEAVWGSTQVARQGALIEVMGLPGFAALEGGVLVGLLAYGVRDRICELVSLSVSSQWQGTGTALINRFTSHVQALDIARLFLVTTNDNLDAIRFYERRGWRLARVDLGAVTQARAMLKPSIPEVGNYGLPIRDELIFEYPLRGKEAGLAEGFAKDEGTCDRDI